MCASKISDDVGNSPNRCKNFSAQTFYDYSSSFKNPRESSLVGQNVLKLYLSRKKEVKNGLNSMSLKAFER